MKLSVGRMWTVCFNTFLISKFCCVCKLLRLTERCHGVIHHSWIHSWWGADYYMGERTIVWKKILLTGECFPESETGLFLWVQLGHMEDEAMPLLTLPNPWECSSQYFKNKPTKQKSYCLCTQRMCCLLLFSDN